MEKKGLRERLEVKNKKINNEFFNNYIEILKNKIFKILPMYESKSDTLKEYTGFLLDELIGCLNLYSLQDSKIFGTVLSLVSFLHYDEFYNHVQCKSHVLSCINSLDKIKQGECDV